MSGWDGTYPPTVEDFRKSLTKALSNDSPEVIAWSVEQLIRVLIEERLEKSPPPHPLIGRVR